MDYIPEELARIIEPLGCLGLTQELKDLLQVEQKVGTPISYQDIIQSNGW